MVSLHHGNQWVKQWLLNCMKCRWWRFFHYNCDKMCLDSFIRRTWRRGSHTPLHQLRTCGNEDPKKDHLSHHHARSWRGLGAPRELLGVDHCLPLSCRTLQGSGWQRPRNQQGWHNSQKALQEVWCRLFTCHQSTQEGGGEVLQGSERFEEQSQACVSTKEVLPSNGQKSLQAIITNWAGAKEGHPPECSAAGPIAGEDLWVAPKAAVYSGGWEAKNKE